MTQNYSLSARYLRLVSTAILFIATSLLFCSTVTAQFGGGGGFFGDSSFKKKPKLTRLSPIYPVWIDLNNKVLVADGEICMREGGLEMFACLKGTKEHESVIAISTKAYIVHAGLLVLGAEPGSPVSFDPKFKPPTGTEIEILVVWEDAEGKRRTVNARDWIKDAKTKKTLQTNWVFAGSSTWTDENTGENFYTAEGGDFICVSNFSSAMLDLPVQSSESNSSLYFLAHTERIPPLGTKVRMFMIPKFDKKKVEVKAEPATIKEEAETDSPDSEVEKTDSKETDEATEPQKDQSPE
ncbi:MAG: YdjY domain-containing protein [Pirellulales bacterium]